MSSVLAEFLQQFFTLIFTAWQWSSAGTESWPGCCCCLCRSSFIRRGKLAAGCAAPPARGQDKLADIQNILHETITGNRIVKAFSMESWEIARFRQAAHRLFRANLRSVAAAAISSPLMDIFGAIAIALLLSAGAQPDQAQRPSRRNFLGLYRRGVQALRSGAQVRPVQ